MAEPVRLVVWDLDGTFWAGTLTEGGHTYSDFNHNIIVELAKRGIVSSICSKNDFETVKAILVEKGIWDYFIFPSISWNPKGPRLKQLAEDVQLRPETILLLDDNPQNLREAEHFVPGIQTADDSFVPQILGSPLFKGKNDAELSRLKQYKLLETRKGDEAIAEDNIEFLRSCEIRVTVEHDIEKHIDRAVELINRTNQLNFTKKRLPEHPDKAREKLRGLLGRLNIQAGIVHVKDRYGDYGYCGLYVMRTRKGQSELVHFCFSCRILGMGIELWLYNRMGRPAIEVRGDVLTDLSSTATADWIRFSSGENESGENTGQRLLSHMVIRGACAVSPLMHYFQIDAQEVAGEFNTVRDSAHQIRVDHTLMLRYALEGLSAAQMEIFHGLGFEAEDFQTAFADSRLTPAVRVLSSWVDLQPILYRHKKTGLLVPYKVKIDGEDIDPLTKLASGAPEFRDLPDRVKSALLYLRENFEAAGSLSVADAKGCYEIISSAIPNKTLLFVLSIPEAGKRGGRGAELNAVVAEVTAKNNRIIPLAITEFAEDNEQMSRGHFHRNVYYRVYQEIRARTAAHFEAAGQTNSPAEGLGASTMSEAVAAE